MHKLLIVVFLFISSSVSANLISNPTNATLTIHNNTWNVWWCSGRLYGYTQYGRYVFVDVQSRVGPGEYHYSYIYTHRGDPFITTNSSVVCQ